MKLSKIRQIIKEELEVILTNEEVGDFFGEDIQRKLEEDEAAEIEAADTDPEAEDKATAAVTASEEGGSQPYKIATESSMPEAAADLLGEPLPEEYSEVLHGIRGVLEMEEFADLDSAVREELQALYNDILEREEAAWAAPEEEEGTIRTKRVTPQSIEKLKRGSGRGIGMGSPRGAASRHKTSQFDR